ncbi:hypothetical protein ACFP2T_38615 [Plantactinospora solaniradicis]|uniref:Uncharacterized protein n=1 Tax=Plantactinospora solaniradicis TaxID=1723736 RepID=A0ABW1KJU6_9ACTN
MLGIAVAASTVWEILREVGIDPAPDRARSTWAELLHSQADALLAWNFFETVTLTGARMYVLAAAELVEDTVGFFVVPAVGSAFGASPDDAWQAEEAEGDGEEEANCAANRFAESVRANLGPSELDDQGGTGTSRACMWNTGLVASIH